MLCRGLELVGSCGSGQCSGRLAAASPLTVDGQQLALGGRQGLQVGLDRITHHLQQQTAAAEAKDWQAA